MFYFRRWTGFALIALLAVLLTGAVNSHGASAASADESLSFNDVPPDHWAYDAVQDMISHGIINGLADGVFGPANDLTREQFAKLLTLALDENLVKVDQPTFDDVSANSWSFPYIETVKNYFEGTLSFGGINKFDPIAIASREDVAVALVKGMKLKMDGINAEQIISSQFTDYGDISSGLRDYVALAIQNHLIEGYPDGTFKPHNGLNRAAAATLLHRLLKASVMTPIKDIALTVTAPTSVETPNIRLSGTVDKDTIFTINGTNISQIGTYSKDYYMDKGDGKYTFELRAVKPNGRYKAVLKHVNVTIPNPKLTAEIPDSTEKSVVTVSGNVTDSNDSRPLVKVNGVTVELSSSGNWSKKLELNEGRNGITVTATNKFSKNSSVQKSVNFTVKPPEINVENISDTVNTKTLKVKGTVSDMNDIWPTLTMNGNSLSGTTFEQNVNLIEGDNTLTFIATNKWGKKTTITKKITYVVLPPIISIDKIDDMVNTNKVMLKVSAFDYNDDSPKLYLNDYYQSTSRFSYDATLMEGENTFTIKSTNSLGKTSTIIKKITYVILPPVLTIDPIPASTNVKTITVKAMATDALDRSPFLYLNGNYVANTTFTQTVTLNEGLNTISFKVISNTGKSTVIDKQITYTPLPPVLTIDPLPDTSVTKTITIKVTTTDVNDSSPRIYINNQYVAAGTYTGTYTLNEGTNTIVFKATNLQGKAIEVTKTILLTTPGPTVTVDPVQATVSVPTVTIKAIATDPNDASPKLYLNGTFASNGSFTQSVTLVPGLNTFVITATNAAGKSSAPVKITVTYSTPTAP